MGGRGRNSKAKTNSQKAQDLQPDFNIPVRRKPRKDKTKFELKKMATDVPPQEKQQETHPKMPLETSEEKYAGVVRSTLLKQISDSKMSEGQSQRVRSRTRA